MAGWKENMINASLEISEKIKFNSKNNDELCLLFVSIGPVQEFIAEARKIRDLWSGSYILSLMTFQAMLPIIKKYNDKAIIYPHISGSPIYRLFKGETVEESELQFAAIPNHFLAIVDNEEIADLMEEACNAVNSYWSGLSDKTRDLIAQLVNSKFKGWDNLWDSQVNDHFQIYWVAEPVAIQDIESNYIEKHKSVQELMKARKLTRTFIQWTGDKSFKCYQCGHREIIGSKGFWQYLSTGENVKRPRFSIKENEKLCAVCLIKRLSKEDDILKGLPKLLFESTSDISSRPFKVFLTFKENEQEVINFSNKIKTLCGILKIQPPASIKEIHSDWLYKKCLHPKPLQKEFPFVNINNLQSVSVSAIELLECMMREFNVRPSKYFAILMLDGDKIGEKISDLDIARQKELSQKLGELGYKILPDIVQKAYGYIVYSGGDDLLALMPLEKSISTAFNLKEAFGNQLGDEFTCSISLVISSHQDSLRRSLEEARKAMQKAKDDFKRNSLVITLMLSSGTIITGGSNWRLKDQPVNFSEFLTKLVYMMTLKSGALGNQFIYNIVKTLPAFYDHKGKLSTDMLGAEIRRLLERHIPQNTELRDINGELSQEVYNTLQYILLLGNTSKQNVNSCNNLAAALRLSGFFVRENIKEM